MALIIRITSFINMLSICLASNVNLNGRTYTPREKAFIESIVFKDDLVEFLHSGGKRVYCNYKALQPFQGEDVSVTVEDDCRIVEDSKGVLDYHFFDGIIISSDLKELRITRADGIYDVYYLKPNRKRSNHDDIHLDVRPAASGGAAAKPISSTGGDDTEKDDLESMRDAERRSDVGRYGKPSGAKKTKKKSRKSKRSHDKKRN